MEKQRDSIRYKLLRIVMLPIFFLGISIVIIGMLLIYGFYSNSIHNELASTTNMLVDCLNLTVRGNYQYEAGMLLKGDINITDSTMLYRIKEESGIDTTIFWEDVRIITTVEDSHGISAVGTKASEKVVEHVLEGGENYFSQNIQINGEHYIGYYVPLENEHHEIVGMVFAGKSKKEVYTAVGGIILCFLIFSAMAVLIASIMSRRFSMQMIVDIDHIKKYLEIVAEGDFTATMEPEIAKRNDELSEIGAYAVKMGEDLQKLIETDPLTTLLNRRSCNHRLKGLTEQKRSYCIVMCDIDWFKKINDQYGHDAGDYVLVQVARMIKESTQDVGFASRWGGEEFLLVYQLDFEETMKCVEKLHTDIASYGFNYDGMEIRITMTFGVKQGEVNVPYERLIKSADYKLYTGKRNGRNQIVS